MDLFDYAKTRLPEADIHYFGTVSRQTLHEIIHEVELVCVLSQYFDPYPTIGLEAIRHGALIILTNTNGISHYFTGVGDILINGINQVPDLDKILSNTENLAELNSKIDLQIPQPLEVVKLYLAFFRNK
jgi:glycosyltransferase involved in cell wall biosynthesis